MLLWIELETAILKTLYLITYAIVFSAIVAVAVGVIAKISDRESNITSSLTQTFFVAFVFCMLAVVTGFLTSTSRESAISEVIPAVLALIGGLALYIVDKGYEKFLVTGISVISFSSMLFFGAALGSFERQKAEARAKSPTLLRRQADVEFAVETYRRALGLKSLSEIAKAEKE